MQELFLPTPGSGRDQVLARYPLAKLAAADLRGLDESVAVEEVIRNRYRDSQHELDRRLFRAIPPYLQELLLSVSYAYTTFPQNYESLVTNLLRLPEVVFISLNYDVLLDNVLAEVDPKMTGMDWYVDPHRHWSLVKLHGSVNWGQNSKVDALSIYTDPPADLELREDIYLRHSSKLHTTRGLSDGRSFAPGDLYYPALSVPVGEEDELVCPASHVEFLRGKLKASSALSLLLIGYSGNDREVLSLIRRSGRTVEALTIVDQDLSGAEAVADRLRRHHGVVSEYTECFDGDFDKWVERGELGRFVAERGD